MELTGPLSWKTYRSLTPDPVDCRTGFENLDHSFWQPTVKKWICYYIFKGNIDIYSIRWCNPHLTITPGSCQLWGTQPIIK